MAGAAHRADAVDLDAMTYDLVVCGVADLDHDVFDIGEGDVFGGAAAYADEVVMVGGVADAIGDGAVAEDEPADQPLVDEELQRAVDGGATDGRELAGEGLGGEVVVTAGDGLDDELSR